MSEYENIVKWIFRDKYLIQFRNIQKRNEKEIWGSHISERDIQIDECIIKNTIMMDFYP